MNEYTDSAVALLAAAVNRRRNARPDELVDEVWKLYDMAEGFGEAFAMLDLDEGKFHPYTVRNARIVSVSDDKGLQVSWLEPDRDTGAMTPNDAYVGSLRHAWQRAALRAAQDLAGTDQLCSIYLSYEKQDGTYTNSSGQAISWIRRVLRVKPYPVFAERTPAGQMPPMVTREQIDERTPAPAPAPRERQPEPAPEVAPQPSLADAEPPPVVVDGRPADPALLAIAEMLSDEELADLALPLRPDVVAAYKGWFTMMAPSQGKLRALNKDAKRRGESVASIHDAQTVLDLLRVVNLTRDLLAEQGAPA